MPSLLFVLFFLSSVFGYRVQDRVYGRNGVFISRETKAFWLFFWLGNMGPGFLIDGWSILSASTPFSFLRGGGGRGKGYIYVRPFSLCKVCHVRCAKICTIGVCRWWIGR